MASFKTFVIDCKTFPPDQFDRNITSVGWINVSNTTASSDSEVLITQTWWMLLLLTLIVITTVSANFLVIILPVVNKELRTPFNLLLMNIAVADGLIGTFDMPQYVAGYVYYGYWPYSQPQCTFWLLIDFLMPSVTLTSMAALSFDRLWAVSYPAGYRMNNTKRKAAVFVTVTWLISLIGVLPGFTYSRMYFSNQSAAGMCQWDVDGLPDWASSFYSLIPMVWMPFLVTLVCYVGTVFKLVQARFARTAIEPTRLSTSDRRSKSFRRMRKRTHRERQAFYVVTLLVVVLFVTYTPWVVYLVRLNVLKYEDPSVFYYVASSMGYALSTINPFMCLTGSRDMRTALRRIFGCGRNGDLLEVPSISKRTTSVGRRATAVRDSTV